MAHPESERVKHPVVAGLVMIMIACGLLAVAAFARLPGGPAAALLLAAILIPSGMWNLTRHVSRNGTISR
jgi:hypothetical protein